MVGFSVYASNPSLSGAPNPPPVPPVPPTVGTGLFTFTSVSAGAFTFGVPPLTSAASRLYMNPSAAVPTAGPFAAFASDTTNMPTAPFMCAGTAGGTITVVLFGTGPGSVSGGILANALVGAETAILSAIAA